MTFQPLSSEEKTQAVQTAWDTYQAQPTFENFLAFSLLLNSLADLMAWDTMSGLVRAVIPLERQVLRLLSDTQGHPLAQQIEAQLRQGVEHLVETMRQHAAHKVRIAERRACELPGGRIAPPPRFPVVVTGKKTPLTQELIEFLDYFGTAVSECPDALPTPDASDESVFLLDIEGDLSAESLARVTELRRRRPICRIFCLSCPDDFNAILCILRAGADRCLMENAPWAQVVNQLLEYGMDQFLAPQEPMKVLVVEDSRTAARVIARHLETNGIAFRVETDPAQCLAAIHEFSPDLILMDMYMPGCTGVEAVRIIRQHDSWLSIPIIYLSGETDVSLQVEALRLGGEHFLTKPFNPVVMNAVIKSKIERYRRLRRVLERDSLSGLLNHTNVKQTLTQLLGTCQTANENFAVAMVDIDLFKRVNDTWGHPVGDQVIRTLSWLLRQRCRASDIIGRYGGEEFVIGLPGVGHENARLVLDRIRENFSKVPFVGTNADGQRQTFHATFSAGVATWHEGDAPVDLDTLLAEADEALYQAKRAGRNQIRLAQKNG
ncbi:MAG: diguanylate cyclase [Zoogloeaceae bacterium]|jgi:diguanylate cyclase (GGDEF)-like protein|nr:diguanylate cyclase [Zoogloeaceae bacterium]